MHARVTLYDGGSEADISGFGQTAQQVGQIEGNQGAMLLVDRQSGKAMTITFWESEQARERSVEQANQLRDQAVSEAGLTVRSVENYEIAFDSR